MPVTKYFTSNMNDALKVEIANLVIVTRFILIPNSLYKYIQ